MIKILIDGPDRVGKTTQINLLKKAYPQCITIHSGALPKDYAQQYYKNLYTIVNSPVDILVDRSHLGEFVYSQLYRGYDGSYIFNDNEPEAKLILLIDDVENLITREDGKSFTTDRDMKQKEIDLFIEAFNKSKIKNKYIINIADKSISEVFKEVNNGKMVDW